MRVLVINGPNLNMLGKRENEFYGESTLADIEKSLAVKARQLKIDIEFFQSNHEGAIIDKIQQSAASGLIINAGAYTHTSIAIRDALAVFGKPVIEVHLSNVYSREEFRRFSYISSVAAGVIAGFKEKSYLMALLALSDLIKNK